MVVEPLYDDIEANLRHSNYYTTLNFSWFGKRIIIISRLNRFLHWAFHLLYVQYEDSLIRYVAQYHCPPLVHHMKNHLKWNEAQCGN